MAETGSLGMHRVSKPIHGQDDKSCLINVLCVFISLVTILADLTTDILVVIEYWKIGNLNWATCTLAFIFIPNILVNIFSIRWFIVDQTSNLRKWISHGCLLGLLERYIFFLQNVFVYKNYEHMKTKEFINQRNDLTLLHFLYIFTGTLPQIILQSYCIVTLNENYYTRAFALTASVASIMWGLSAYIYSNILSPDDSNNIWVSFALQLSWQFGMLLSRIFGILLFSLMFGLWILIPMGLHWLIMIFLIVLQNTNFCPSKPEEFLYNIVMGFVYCFCYVNLRDGRTRYRLILYYTCIVIENIGCVCLFILNFDLGNRRQSWFITASICIIGGTVTGLSTMILYYRYYHSKGPIPWKHVVEDAESNNKKDISNEKANLAHTRSFKSAEVIRATDSTSRIKTSIPEQSTHSESENADKNFLLDHWINRSATPIFKSIPVGNNSMEISTIEVYSVENTPQSLNNGNADEYELDSSDNIKANKKRTVCAPTELILKLSSIQQLESSIDEITSSNFNLQKRRGICSSDELREGIALNLDTCDIITEHFVKKFKNDHTSEISHDTDGSNKKTSSDSIDLDLDLSFSDINSSDINTYNENIVQKLCLSALKNIKVGNQNADIENIQRIAVDILKEMYAKKDKRDARTALSSKQRDIDTPTEMLSVHDYENICAVNIAREAWGLRSWNGYCDIENWLHDGSIVRDRRRDTLTSGSSEISSCLSQELKSIILNAQPFPKKAHTYSNVFIKPDSYFHEDYANAVISQSSDDNFAIKTCTDGKDSAHLEPILEELDDLGDVDPCIKKRLNSESSLVATIDEIRKATIANSPRNSYHRRENYLWDSPELSRTKVDETIKNAFWKEPFKFDISNSMESMPEKENVFKMSQSSLLNLTQNDSVLITEQFASGDTLVGNFNNGSKRYRRSNGSSFKLKRNNCISSASNDVSNKEIDFLWQLVTDNSLAVSSAEDLTNRTSSSQQSLIQKDKSTQNNAACSKSPSVTKKPKTKPRRKISILREKFEPKLNVHSDEETLCYLDKKKTNSEFDLTIIKNVLEGASNENVILKENISNSIESKSKDLSTEIILTDFDLGQPKEKFTIAMKQVLAPSKIQAKIKNNV